mgnify:CR=1 FL=1
MKLPRALLPGKRSARYVDAADALRVIATALVAAYHIWQQSWINLNIRLFGMNVNLRPLVSTGYLGVEMLLMLSGFLLYLPYANGQEAPARTFYRKRAARILPSYWFCILIMLFAFALPQHKYASGGALAKDLIAHATFTHNLFPETYFATPLNGAMWTLAVEVQFYVLAPLICRFFRKKPAIAYAGMVLIAAAYRYLYVLPMEDTTYFMNRLPKLLDVYANGMLFAHIYARLSRKRQKPWQAWAATAISLLAIVLMYLLAHSQSRISGYELSRRGQMARRFAFSALGGAFLVFGSRSVRMMRALPVCDFSEFLYLASGAHAEAEGMAYPRLFGRFAAAKRGRTVANPLYGDLLAGGVHRRNDGHLPDRAPRGEMDCEGKERKAIARSLIFTSEYESKK